MIFLDSRFCLSTSLLLAVLLLGGPGGVDGFGMLKSANAGTTFFIGQQDDDSDVDDEDDDEFEDDADFTNNPFRIDERKLFAAKKFQLSKQYAMKIKLMADLCDLDKKQQLKLKIAAKGATEKAVEKYEKTWRQYIGQFGGFQNVNDGDKKKKKKKRRKKKRFVVTDVDQIDAQTLQMLDQAGMGIGGVKKSDVSEVSLWKSTVKKVLSEEQRKRIDQFVKNAKLAKRKARADTFIADMRLRLSLSEKQLDEFSKIVLPAFMEKDLEVQWNYEAMATMYLGSKHDKKKMKALLTDEQQLMLKIALKPAEGYAGMFGDNNNNNVIFVEANDHGEVFAFAGVLDGLFDTLVDVADFVENTIEGVLSWQN